MPRFHLTITIFNPFFEGKLKSRGKIDSVGFYDYDVFFEKVLQGLTYSEIQKFKFNLFECYKHSLCYVNTSQFTDEGVKNGYSIISQDFNVSSNIIARCIPSRRVRDEYFDYDLMKERYYIKSDFIYYLKG